MRSASMGLAVAGLLLLTQAAAWARESTVEERVYATADSVAEALRAAIASGEWSRVAVLFHTPVSPVLDHLKRSWHDMRAGRLDPTAWEVGFAPFYAHSGRMGGLLTITSVEGDRTSSARFAVTLLRRGATWLFDEPLPLDRGEVALTRQDLDVDLRDAGGRLVADDTLTLMPAGPDRRVFLKLAPQLQASAATLDGAPWPIVQHEEWVYLEVPETPGPFRLTLHYEGPLAAGPAEAPRVLRADESWYPRLGGDRPAPSVYRLRAQVPVGRLATAPGQLDGVDRFSEGWRYQWTTPQPIASLTLYTGTWRRAEATGGAIPLEAYLVPPHDTLADPLFGEVGRTIGFFSVHFGAFPYQKLAIVEAPSPVGDDGPAALAFPSEAWTDPNRADDTLSRGVARAYTGHVPFVGRVGEVGFMREGLANYLGALYRGERDGAPAFRETLAGFAERFHAVAGTPADRALADAPAALDEAQLAKGAMVVHMMRRSVGDAAFDQGLKTVFGSAAASVDLPAFQRAFEKPAGKSLGNFFQQWLGRSGEPTFALDDLELVALPKGRYEVWGTLVQPLPAYALTLPLVIVGKGKPTLYEVPVRSVRTEFRLKVPDRPKRLLVDPLHDLLMAPVAPIDLP